MLVGRSITTGDRPILGSFSPEQNRAILIVGLTCASVSLITTLVTLRWFILMKRLFRHRLVLYLILSDTFKALWYFVFPIVVFAQGGVESSSAWCQASGFLLALAVEASDFAILLIALHAVLYVFRPPIRFGEGGLYPYRKWLPLAWLGFPILAACLAFVNRGNAYVTAGTFCYLPQRPYWYRLALAWIPRYLILFTILGMYAAISIYVRVKFRSFKNLSASDPPSGEHSARRPSLEDAESPAGALSPTTLDGRNDLSPHSHDSGTRSPSSMNGTSTLPFHQEPWDSMNFITSNALRNQNVVGPGIDAADFAHRLDSSEAAVPPPTRSAFPCAGHESDIEKLRQDSDIPSVVAAAKSEDQTNMSQTDSSFDDYQDRLITDPLKRTRLAIRQQLRFLFIYPAVYILMWAFPFANHCLLYSDKLASRPIFWLQILSTCALALQAAANCLIFSLREKPWRRIDENSKFALPFWRHQSASLVRKIGHNASGSIDSRKSSSLADRRETFATDQTAVERQSRGPDWWEAEGRKRKDSVWLGTDLTNYMTSRTSGENRSRVIEEEQE